MILLGIRKWSPAQAHGTHRRRQEMSELQKQLDAQHFRTLFHWFSVFTTAHVQFLWKADNTHKNICFIKAWFPAKIFPSANFQSVPDTIFCKWHQNCWFYLKQTKKQSNTNISTYWVIKCFWVFRFSILWLRNTTEDYLKTRWKIWLNQKVSDYDLLNDEAGNSVRSENVFALLLEGNLVCL